MDWWVGRWVHGSTEEGEAGWVVGRWEVRRWDEGVERGVDEWVEVAEGGWMVNRRWMDAMKR